MRSWLCMVKAVTLWWGSNASPPLVPARHSASPAGGSSAPHPSPAVGFSASPASTPSPAGGSSSPHPSPAVVSSYTPASPPFTASGSSAPHPSPAVGSSYTPTSPPFPAGMDPPLLIHLQLLDPLHLLHLSFFNNELIIFFPSSS